MLRQTGAIRIITVPQNDICRDFLTVCVRAHKSGSTSLSQLIKLAFSDWRIFYLPTTYHRDSEFSLFQRYRGLRSRAQNLFKHYRTFSIAHAYDTITLEAADGDAIDGGHIDFPSVCANVPRRVKMITLLRDPFARVRSDYNYCREGYLKKPFFNRFDAGILHKIAARFDFEGFLDFMLEHKTIYGNLASTQIGWDGNCDLQHYFKQNVFHAGVLEQRDGFAAELSRKLNKSLSFPHANRTETALVGGIGQRERVKIERLYERDFTLYEWVRDNY